MHDRIEEIQSFLSHRDYSLARRRMLDLSLDTGSAVLLKDVLRGRSILLIEDRTDIVGAAEADGVVLSRQGCRSSSQSGT